MNTNLSPTPKITTAGLPFWWLKSSLLILLLWVTAIANAFEKEDIAQATKHMENGDFAKAYCLIEPLATNGNAEAQYLLGWMYHNGYGLRINDDKTIALWSKSAKQGNVEADYSIGLMYEIGAGVRIDSRKAVDAYLASARQGHQDSLVAVKRMLNNQYVQDYLLEISIEEYELFKPSYQIRVKRANVRQGPDPKSKIVSVLEKGTQVVVLEKTKSWSKIILRGKGKTAWVFSTLLAKIKTNVPS